MDFKKIWPHLAAIGILLAIACVFFAPVVFSGKVLSQGDNDQAKGMQTEIFAEMKKTGEAPLWTNSAFCGMPAYQVYQPTPSNLTRPVFYGALLGQGVTSPWAAIFLAMVSLYLLLLALRVDWRVAVVGAATFGISIYNVDILEAGHSTKMIALAFLPGIFAGAIWSFHGRYLLGAGMTALFTALQLFSNHFQITYYGLLLLGLFFAVTLVYSLKNKAALSWLISTSVTGVALAIALGSNAARLLPTLEFGKETIRGKSELAEKKDKGDGLDEKYIFDWSLGKLESNTLMVPHFAGGGAAESFKGTDTYDRLASNIISNMTQQGYSAADARRQAERQVAGLFYTGAQPFVGTAIYYGAAVLFLFFLGCFLVRGPEKWWLAFGALFCVTLAWGKYFFLNHLFVDYLPMFNKFRAVTMALGPGQLMVCILAALGLQKFFDGDILKENKQKAMLYALAAALGWCVLIFLGSFVMSFDGPNDASLGKNNPEILKMVLGDRASLVRTDVMRSMLFILLTAGALWFYLQKTIKSGTAVLVLGLIAVADIWLVATRTLTPSKYETAKAAKADPVPTPADQQVMADKDPYFRVLDLSRGGITGNAQSSLFFKSFSGYSAAKMALYQDVVEKYLNSDLQKSLHIVGMLNGKYIITPGQQGEPRVLPNPKVMGNAWFVKNIVTVPDADAELGSLATLNPRDTLVVQQKNAADVASWKYAGDSTDYIKLTSYSPDKMVYEYSAKSESVAAFSEVYDPHSKGWNCYLNGQLMPDQIFKADYLLRALKLPAGQKQSLEMRFEPNSVKMGNSITLFSSALVLLLFVLGLFFNFKKHDLDDPNRLDEMPEETSSKKVIAEEKGKKRR